MAGIIERNARETYTILTRSCISDGKQVFGGTVSCSGFSIDFRDTTGGVLGTVSDGKKFFVAPCYAEITIPCKVTFAGKTYSVKSVKELRNLKGELLGYKLCAIGA